MRLTKTFISVLLASVTIGNVSIASGSDNEFMLSKAWAYSSTWVNSDSNPDYQYHQTVGAPRHYVSAYQLLITDLFGYQFQCANSSTWASTLDQEENPDECSVYLQANAMRYSGAEHGFFPYANAGWEGILLVDEHSNYEFEYSPDFYHHLTYGTEANHVMTVTIAKLGTNVSARFRRHLNDNNPAYYTQPDSFLTSGVWRISVIVESYFPLNPYYFGFEIQQGGVYFRVRRTG